MGDMITKIESYREIYSQLKSRMRWKVSDSRILMMAASLYVTHGREFNVERFEELTDFIKQEVGIFSTLKSQTRYTIAAMLDTKCDDPKKKFKEFEAAYEELIAQGFSRSVFSYIAAMALMSTEEDKKETASRARAIYKKMREGHFFLTGQGDFPLAVLMAQSTRNQDELMNSVEDLYKKLDKEGFRKGNDLQCMSHILSLHETAQQAELVSRCTNIYDSLKGIGIKPKAKFYPHIALLSFLSDNSKEHLPAVKETWESLNNEKLFKWHKDINFMMAVTFFISDKIENSSMFETSLYTTIETLIQAQQAASVAAISSTAAAAASAGGS